MSTLIVRAREMSLALLVVAVIEHGCVAGGDYSGAAPSSSGLIRLGRDLMRRAGGEAAADVAASNWIHSRNRRVRAHTGRGSTPAN
jgi:hypothetical protein